MPAKEFIIFIWRVGFISAPFGFRPGGGGGPTGPTGPKIPPTGHSKSVHKMLKQNVQLNYSTSLEFYDLGIYELGIYELGTNQKFL